ncbi:MAG: pirin family protein [Gammaproteobacteria bacterium]|nr:pirin family protein [Gammaproteobacteria bacterium]
MKKIIHRAESRGAADHGWLRSKHTFSFANYYNPERMGFGKLRVLNDDIIDAATGFDTHSHDNMEIISVPIRGELRHRDSIGNTYVIRENEVQVMSAGTGVSHSEYNNSDSLAANFLQIWILPKLKNIEPRYEQRKFDPEQRHNRFLTVVAPDNDGDSIWINQDVWFSLGDFDSGNNGNYSLHKNGNGLYIFVISGQIRIDSETLNDRDAIGITDVDSVTFETLQSSQLLMIEIPM